MLLARRDSSHLRGELGRSDVLTRSPKVTHGVNKRRNPPPHGSTTKSRMSDYGVNKTIARRVFSYSFCPGSRVSVRCRPC